ncbi:hypothetical protein Tco_0701354 [Tanacetum coccineum]
MMKPYARPVAPPTPIHTRPEDTTTPPIVKPLPPVDSPTAKSPGYVTESDPEEDPEDYEDDETEDGLVDYLMDMGDDGDDDDGNSSRDGVMKEMRIDEDEISSRRRGAL